MKLEFAKLIVKAGSDMGYDDECMSVREAYSGRGMYGRETAGVVFDSLGKLLAAVAHATECMITDEDDAGDLISDLEKCRTDNMGRDTILY